MSYLFSFSRYQTKCVINPLMPGGNKRREKGRKRGEDGNTKNWISWERKELFR